uniref:Uncharacterized protein LOC108041772 n=1 Tax=Drosophila rhopaloa TaxID=1041015 RepID=A0A6P4EB58_DRORH
MAFENNENNEDITNGAIPTADNEMTAYLEKCLLKLRAENAQKAAEIADMKEQMKMLQAEKYATLISIIHSRNVVPNIEPYHELKKHIENIKKDVEEINANTSLIAEELKTKKKWFNLTQKSLVNEIRVLTHIERDAIEMVEDLKSENLMLHGNNIF